MCSRCYALHRLPLRLSARLPAETHTCTRAHHRLRRHHHYHHHAARYRFSLQDPQSIARQSIYQVWCAAIARGNSASPQH